MPTNSKDQTNKVLVGRKSRMKRFEAGMSASLGSFLRVPDTSIEQKLVNDILETVKTVKNPGDSHPMDMPHYLSTQENWIHLKDRVSRLIKQYRGIIRKVYDGGDVADEPLQQHFVGFMDDECVTLYNNEMIPYDFPAKAEAIDEAVQAVHETRVTLSKQMGTEEQVRKMKREAEIIAMLKVDLPVINEEHCNMLEEWNNTQSEILKELAMEIVRLENNEAKMLLELYEDEMDTSEDDEDEDEEEEKYEFEGKQYKDDEELQAEDEEELLEEVKEEMEEEIEEEMEIEEDLDDSEEEDEEGGEEIDEEVEEAVEGDGAREVQEVKCEGCKECGYEEEPKVEEPKKPTEKTKEELKQLKVFSADDFGGVDANGMVSIGPHGTKVRFDNIKNIHQAMAPPAITRKILCMVFGREMLAFHTLTGKPSPAFKDCIKPTKGCLDGDKVADIMHMVTRKLDITPREVRNAITTKCADENKMYRARLKKEAALGNGVDGCGGKAASPKGGCRSAGKKNANKDSAGANVGQDIDIDFDAMDVDVGSTKASGARRKTRARTHKPRKR